MLEVIDLPDMKKSLFLSPPCRISHNQQVQHTARLQLRHHTGKSNHCHITSLKLITDSPLFLISLGLFQNQAPCISRRRSGVSAGRGNISAVFTFKLKTPVTFKCNGCDIPCPWEVCSSCLPVLALASRLSRILWIYFQLKGKSWNFFPLGLSSALFVSSKRKRKITFPSLLGHR